MSVLNLNSLKKIFKIYETQIYMNVHLSTTVVLLNPYKVVVVVTIQIVGFVTGEKPEKTMLFF